MRVLFVTHRTHAPDAAGGAQHSIHALLTGTLGLGHSCTAVATFGRGPRRAWFRLVRRATARRVRAFGDGRAGYPVTRTWDPLIAEVAWDELERRRPEVVVADVGERTRGFAHRVAEAGIPLVLRVVDTQFTTGLFERPARGSVRVVANSEFIAGLVRRQVSWAVDVVHPPVDVSRYAVTRRAPAFVTFVNPRPVKGLELALEAARRLPAQRFLFVESWPLPREQWAQLRARTAALPNVTVKRRTSDMRRVFAQTRLLIVPSACEEAFGRVVLEAHASGIPVVARDIGGLGEALGAGGILMPRDAGAAEWAGAIDRLNRDEAAYARLSAAALANVRRPELAPEELVLRFVRVLDDARREGEPATAAEPARRPT